MLGTESANLGGVRSSLLNGSFGGDSGTDINAGDLETRN